MAKDKKSFLLYCDLIHTIEKLPNEKAGELFKIILQYVNDKNPIIDDLLLQISFEPIKQSLKRDLIKYSQFVEKQSFNGSKGGRPKKAKESQKTQAFIEKPKKADSDSVSDIDIIKDIYDSEFISIVETWLKYKKERKETYKSKIGVSLFCKELKKVSEGDNVKALKVIEKSMANNWAGIFELKGNEVKPEIKIKTKEEINEQKAREFMSRL